MNSKYFVDVEELKGFIFYLRFKDINYTIIPHKQICSKFEFVYMVYEVKYEGDCNVF